MVPVGTAVDFFSSPGVGVEKAACHKALGGGLAERVWWKGWVSRFGAGRRGTSTFPGVLTEEGPKVRPGGPADAVQREEAWGLKGGV